jgi:hypothetical protein
MNLDTKQQVNVATPPYCCSLHDPNASAPIYYHLDSIGKTGDILPHNKTYRLDRSSNEKEVKNDIAVGIVLCKPFPGRRLYCLKATGKEIFAGKETSSYIS